MSLPKWYLVPVVVGQVAIAATMATSPRFTTSQFYPEGLVLFVSTAGVALVVIWRRWQRQAMELQRELEAISVSGLASSESSHDHVCSRFAVRVVCRNIGSYRETKYR